MYRQWPVGQRPVKFKKSEYQARPEDREFASTTITDYVAHPKSAIQVPVKRKQEYVPNVNKFEGISTQNSDYVPIDINAVRASNPNATPSATKLTALTDRQGTFSITNTKDKFTAQSEYTDIYQYRQSSAASRVVPGKRISSKKYEPNPHKFEGVSTQQTDYQEPSNVSNLGIKVYERVKSFKPAELIRDGGATKNSKEDRDFATETKDGFIVKVLEKCPVSVRAKLPEKKADDGHFYYEDVSNSVQNLVLA